MKLVKLNAIDSTNNYLKNLVKDTSTENWTIVSAEHQTLGRGQVQNKWHSDPGKNLTFSVLCYFDDFSVSNAFYLNCAVSLAVFKVLEKSSIDKLNIKWPNDILSHSKKLCGILIENTVHDDRITRSIIGIGLNVNQVGFSPDLANATSMKALMAKDFDRDLILQELISSLKEEIGRIEQKAFTAIKNTYEKQLYRRGIPSMFRNTQGHQFMGIVQGIDDRGKLLIELESESVKAFDFKEIQFI